MLCRMARFECRYFKGKGQAILVTKNRGIVEGGRKDWLRSPRVSKKKRERGREEDSKVRLNEDYAVQNGEIFVFGEGDSGKSGTKKSHDE